MNYAPQGKPRPVVKAGEFIFAAAHLDHGHIYGQCNGLLEAGGESEVGLRSRREESRRLRRQVSAGKSRPLPRRNPRRPGVHLVTAAAVPCDRGPLGVRVMEAGKDYFTDKTPFTSLPQLDDAKAAVARTRRKYMVYFSERLHVESAMYATDLVAGGAIGG
jgi:hypothetical protein